VLLKASLGEAVETVRESELDVFGIRRVVQSDCDAPVEWLSYYSPEGLLTCYRRFTVSLVVAPA